ncbi:unnamed protein product [Cuscuta campestris]|uniref:CCHC-type domain-containing protein n=1 Tax=Cuscuta campestris TaxID=132261 RepID=A0A484M0N3_9ASTE|nr:unnamed protein product [Cuscuta campestris]
MHNGESKEAGASVFAVKNKKEVKELVCSHCGKGGHDVEACYKLIGYPEGWIFRDQAGRGRGNNRGRGNFCGPGRGAGRSTVTGGRSETPREDALRSNSTTSYFEDAEELSTRDHLDRSWRNGGPSGNGDAEELQTIDLVDRADDHGRPSEGQNDGPSGEESTVDRVMEDGRPSSRQKTDAPAQLQMVDPVDRSTDGSRPSLRQKSDEPATLQTVDPVDRSTDGGRPSSSQQAVETLGRSQRERRPNHRTQSKAGKRRLILTASILRCRRRKNSSATNSGGSGSPTYGDSPLSSGNTLHQHWRQRAGHGGGTPPAAAAAFEDINNQKPTIEKEEQSRSRTAEEKTKQGRTDEGE